MRSPECNVMVPAMASIASAARRRITVRRATVGRQLPESLPLRPSASRHMPSLSLCIRNRRVEWIRIGPTSEFGINQVVDTLRT